MATVDDTGTIATETFMKRGDAVWIEEEEAHSGRLSSASVNVPMGDGGEVWGV